MDITKAIPGQKKEENYTFGEDSHVRSGGVGVPYRTYMLFDCTRVEGHDYGSGGDLPSVMGVYVSIHFVFGIVSRKNKRERFDEARRGAPRCGWCRVYGDRGEKDALMAVVYNPCFGCAMV